MQVQSNTTSCYFGLIMSRRLSACEEWSCVTSDACVCLLQYELLFCVDDSSDASIMVVNSLIQKYPQVSARLFAGGLFHYRTARPQSRTLLHHSTAYCYFLFELLKLLRNNPNIEIGLPKRPLTL